MFSKTCLLIWLLQNKRNFFNSLSSDPKNVGVNSTLLPYLCFIFSFWVQISLFKKNCVVGRRTTRDSKHGFGIFRTVLLQLPEEQLSRFTKPSTYVYIFFQPSHWSSIWRILRKSPLSEEKYPNRNPAWKQALQNIDFQFFL